jgi:hypothetical protein
MLIGGSIAIPITFDNHGTVLPTMGSPFPVNAAFSSAIPLAETFLRSSRFGIAQGLIATPDGFWDQ